MDAEDFRRIALKLAGAEEGSHMGSADFRVGGRIFATLASQHQGYGNLMLTPEQQTAFVEEAPDIFAGLATDENDSGARPATCPISALYGKVRRQRAHSSTLRYYSRLGSPQVVQDGCNE